MRRPRDGRVGFGQRVERFGEEFVEVVELTALEIALDAGFGFRSCDLQGYGAPPVKKWIPSLPYIRQDRRSSESVIKDGFTL